MSDSHGSSSSSKPLVLAITLILLAYLISAGMQLPQKGTELVNAGHGDEHAAEEHADDAEHADVEHAEEEAEHSEEAAHEEEADEAADGEETEEHAASDPPYWMAAPFAVLLLCIAVLPLIPATEHWWEQNKNRFIVAAVLGSVTLLYYLVLHDMPVEGHWPGHSVVEPSAGLNWASAFMVFANAILHEYIPFIMLLFALYTISGGIRIEGDLPAHPSTNLCFILVGGLLASFIGTTGAAMLLIRPLLETNKERKYVTHTVVFFIFVVCNCGGCLLPIGDPPLFLGYLRGVPFMWTMCLWQEWLFVNAMLLGIYFVWDHFVAYPREEKKDVVRDETQVRGLKFSGLWPNVPLLLGVVLSVALLDPSKPLGDWHPWMYSREIVQLALVLLSLLLGSQLIRKANNFSYHAIVEVAALFFGIFICMQAPLQILNVEGPNLGLTTPNQFFWLTGSLSAVLDNAPTYVVFFETAKTLGGADTVAGVATNLLVAISLGAVFMGAMTYIGNGPNFMVKAIAEKSGVKMPSFFGYMVYSVCILLPVMVLMTFIFIR